MYYRRTLDILQCAELQLIGRPSPWPTKEGYRRVADTVFGGPWLVVAGGHILLRKIPWIILVAMVCFLPMLLFSEGRWTELIIPSLVFASGAVYFGMSSLSLAAMVKEADLKCVRDSILSSCNNSEELALLEAGLAVARAAAIERLSRQGVIVGVLWGVLFWLLATHVLSPGLSPEDVGRGISMSLVGGLVFVLYVAVGSCHSVAIRAVHHTIDFALLEAKSLTTQAYVQSANHQLRRADEAGANTTN